MSQLVPDINKQVRGINSANQKIVGNNYATEKVLNDMLYQLQPMGELAVAQLGEATGQVSSIVNQLMSEDANLSEEDAYAYAQRLFNMQYRGDSVLQNGSVREQMEYINVLDKGQNIYDPTQYADVMGTQMETTLGLSKLAPGFGSTLDGLLSSTVGSSIGIGSKELMAMYSSGFNEDDINKIVKNGKETGNMTKEEAEKMTKKLANGELQTKKTKQDIFMENMTNDFDVLLEKLGH